MNVRAIKTADTEAVVSRIKRITKREVKDISLEIPQEFIEKRNYMQSDEFLKDEHNERMFSIGEELMEIRDKIGHEVELLNKHTKEKFVQAINGFARKQEDLEKNNSLHFEEISQDFTNSDIEYRLWRNVLLHAEARK